MSVQSVAQLQPERVGWRAGLELSLERDGDRTVVRRAAHSGPLRIQRAFHTEGDLAHVYVLHPPGGLVGGDELDMQVSVRSGGAALLTTVGATKFYRTTRLPAAQHVTLNVADRAQLEWLPQESIYYAGCDARNVVRVNLEPGARFMGWETTCLGRSASGEHFDQGAVRQRFEMFRGVEPIFVDRALYKGGDAALTEAWGLSGHPVVGTFVCAGATQVDVEAARTSVLSHLSGANDRVRLGATLVGEVLVVRAVAPWARLIRDQFQLLWSALRERLFSRPACTPRIWFT